MWYSSRYCLELQKLWEECEPQNDTQKKQWRKCWELVRWCWSFILNFDRRPEPRASPGTVSWWDALHEVGMQIHSTHFVVPTLFLICYIAFLYEIERIKTNTWAAIVWVFFCSLFTLFGVNCQVISVRRLHNTPTVKPVCAKRKKKNSLIFESLRRMWRVLMIAQVNSVRSFVRRKPPECFLTSFRDDRNICCALSEFLFLLFFFFFRSCPLNYFPSRH